MDRKSAISQKKTEKLKNPILLHQKAPKNVVHETFKIDNSDFPSLNDVSVKTRNQNKTSSEYNKTSFSYSDKLKAPPQECASSFFKFEKELNDFNKNECSSHDPQLSLPKNNSSQSKHNTKNQFRSYSDTSREKQVQKSSGSHTFVPNNQTSLTTENVETTSSVHISKESSSDAEGWTLYHKHSSAKHMHGKYKDGNIPERGFRYDCKDGEQASESSYPKYENFCNSTGKNQSSKHVVSKAYAATSAKDGRYRLDIHREVPYNNSARNVSKNFQTKHEVYSASSSKQTSYKEPKSDDRTRIRTYNNNISINYSPGNPKVNNFGDKSEFCSVPSNTTQIEMSHSKQQIHNGSGNPNKNISRNQIHPNPDNLRTSHPNKGQRSEQMFTDSTATKTKKKRKSKIKRQAALQTGKIFLLTPEAHLKILNQANSASIKSQSNAITNFNDDEEYPELGIGVVPKNNKEMPVKISEGDLKVECSLSSSDNVLHVENNVASISQSNNDIIESSGTDVNAEKVISTEAGIANVPAHSSNQITVSLFDMLLTKKSKKKEVEDKVLEEDASVEHSPVKVRTKKVVSQPVNSLASSKPTVKRGKEREQPKAKKPSKMRKLILMGRQIKKDNIALKETDIHINDQSDVDTDVLSDGSTLSPSKSPVYRETDLHDSPKNNSLAMNSDVLEDKLPVSINNCKKMLFTDIEFQERKSPFSPKQSNDTDVDYPKETLYSIDSSTTTSDSEKNPYDSSLSCSYNDVAHKLSPRVKEINEHKTLINNVENENCVIYSDDFDNLRGNLKINDMQEKLFENSQRVQTIENKNQFCVKSMTIDMYFTTLIQSIIDDCMDEIKSRQSEISVEKKAEIVNSKDNISRDISKLDIPINFTNKIDSKCNNLAQSILDDCLFEVKILQNENISCLDLSEKSTPRGSCLSVYNFSMVKDVALLSESIKSNIEELSEDNCCDTNDTNGTNTSENCGQVIDTKVVSSYTLNCSSVINSECELTISDVKLQPSSPSLEKSAVQVNTELPESKFSDKEKMEAAKVLLHTRRFRDYCTHFVTKDLDTTVFTLLDDLARFQDRMHQKDPVKARVKRRLMYGIKEIKKHLTLKKLKGIIIATDIEDNKTEGGLNDLLRELISLSEAYHIPYVFSHKRFNLGKVCRKPAPVSCVGILNYEGSEKNFKKMLELQEENQADYTVITKKIVQLLTDDHITSLFETVQKSIIPYEISKFIMKELFGNDLLGEENKNSELTVMPEIASLKFETKVSSSVTKPEFSISNKNCELIEDYFEESKIHSILKKYNVIKT